MKQPGGEDMHVAKFGGEWQPRELRGALLVGVAAILIAGSAVSQPVAPEARLALAVDPTTTALADAARDGNRNAIRELLPGTEDIDAPGSDGTPALHWIWPGRPSRPAPTPTGLRATGSGRSTWLRPTATRK